MLVKTTKRTTVGGLVGSLISILFFAAVYMYAFINPTGDPKWLFVAILFNIEYWLHFLYDPDWWQTHISLKGSISDGERPTRKSHY